MGGQAGWLCYVCLLLHARKPCCLHTEVSALVSDPDPDRLQFATICYLLVQGVAFLLWRMERETYKVANLLSEQKTLVLESFLVVCHPELFAAFFQKG